MKYVVMSDRVKPTRVQNKEIIKAKLKKNSFPAQRPHGFTF